MKSVTYIPPSLYKYMPPCSVYPHSRSADEVIDILKNDLIDEDGKCSSEISAFRRLCRI